MKSRTRRSRRWKGLRFSCITLIIKTGVFLFSFLAAERKKKQKRKTAGCRSEAKISALFLKKKNSLALKQLFLLYGKEQKFLHASPLKAGILPNLGKSTLLCSLSIKVRPHFFTVKRRERDGTLKRKSCLSAASSFSLVESPTGVGKKVQTANFLCFVSFVRAKEMTCC